MLLPCDPKGSADSYYYIATATATVTASTTTTTMTTSSVYISGSSDVSVLSVAVSRASCFKSGQTRAHFDGLPTAPLAQPVLAEGATTQNGTEAAADARSDDGCNSTGTSDATYDASSGTADASSDAAASTGTADATSDASTGTADASPVGTRQGDPPRVSDNTTSN